MRHGKKFNHLGRKAAHRKAMLANMACSLIEHKRIKTTLAKAKALRVYIEPLITKSKNDTTHSRRVVFSYLKQKDAITELFGDISSKITDRNGGYTRILKLSNRMGDNAQMSLIELVDYNSEYSANVTKTKKARRRGGKKNSTDNISSVDVPLAEVVEETPAAEVVEETPASEVVEETPAAEVVEETPAEEVVEEIPAAEVVEETPAAEVVEEIPAAEVVEETPAEDVVDKTDDSKTDDKEKSKKD